MGKAKRQGIADAFIRRLQERRKTMLLRLTKEAVALLFVMFKAPDTQWERKEQYRGDDFKARREFSAISKWVDAKLLSAEQIPSDADARQIIDFLNKVYDPKAPHENLKEQAWKQAREFGSSRKYLDGSYSVKTMYVERIQVVLDFYIKKDSKTLSPTHYGDLERALKGEAPMDADEVVDVDEVAKEAAAAAAIKKE
jgi:hypothetical protein